MSKIITFYSYKGGVGRSMALANVAVKLSGLGHKTLIIDWDLEAPGLEFYFKEYLDLSKIKTKPGIIDILKGDHSTNLKSTKWTDCISTISIDNATPSIHFISSGSNKDNYYKKVQEFDLDSFFNKNKGQSLLYELRNEWLNTYDFILIDSRTGITDYGGICTILLPDVNILFVTTNDQSLTGSEYVFEKAHQIRKQLPYDYENIIFVPILSRYDATEEYQISQDWIKKIDKSLSKLYEKWTPRNIITEELIQQTSIPYIPYFSYGERLAVLEESSSMTRSLSNAYENLSALIANNFQYLDDMINNRRSFLARASKIKNKDDLRLRHTVPLVNSPDLIHLNYDNHQKWLSTNGSAGDQMDIKNKEFLNLELFDLNLGKSEFNTSTMKNSNFTFIDFSHSSYRYSNFSGSKFTSSNLSSIDGFNAIYINVIFDGVSATLSDLSTSNLTDAIIKNSDFFQSNLDDCNMQNSKLQNSNFDLASFKNSDLNSSNLEHSNFYRSNFANANLRSCICYDADFKGANFSDANLAYAKGLKESQLKMTILDFAKLPDHINFSDSLNSFGKNLKSVQSSFWITSIIALTYLFALINYLTIGNSKEFIIFLPNLQNFAIPQIIAIIISMYYSQSLWDKISKLPCSFPDGKTLHEKGDSIFFVGNIFPTLQRNNIRANPFRSILFISLYWGSTSIIYVSGAFVIYTYPNFYPDTNFTFSFIVAISLSLIGILSYFYSNIKLAKNNRPSFICSHEVALFNLPKKMFKYEMLDLLDNYGRILSLRKTISINDDIVWSVRLESNFQVQKVIKSLDRSNFHNKVIRAIGIPIGEELSKTLYNRVK